MEDSVWCPVCKDWTGHRDWDHEHDEAGNPLPWNTDEPEAT